MIRHMILLLVMISTSFSSLAKNTYDIGFMVDNRSSETDVLLQKLQNEITAVVGEDANIRFPADQMYVNNYQLSQAQQHYQQLLDSPVDIIIAFGVITNEVVSKQTVHRKPTILFGAINQDYNDLDITQKTSGIKNFTYLIESESFKEDLSKLKQLTDFKNIGIVVDAGIVQFLHLKDTFGPVLNDLNSDYQIIAYQQVNDIVDQLVGIDALYLAGGFFLKQDEVQLLANALVEHKIPSFTINGVEQVKLGIMASHQAAGDIDQFFRRIALTVDDYVSGTPLSQMPVFIDYTSQLTINYNTAEAIGVPIKYSLLADTDFVGEFHNVLSESNYNLIQVIEQVLDKNLSLEAARINVDLAAQNLVTSRNNYKPNISTSLSGTYIDQDLAAISNGSNPEYSSAGNLTISQTLYSNAANANISIQKSLLQAQQEQFNTEELDSIFAAINAYFNVLILKTNAQIQLLNLRLTKDNLKLAQQSFEIGQSGKSDTLRFQSAKAQNTQAMVEASNQLEQAYIQLNQLLNNPIDFEIDIKDVQLDQGVFENYNYNLLTELLDDPALRNPFIEFVIMKAKQNAPELKALAHNLAAAEAEITLNGKRRFLPTVALQGQYNKTFDRSGAGSEPPIGGSFLNDNYTVGLSVSVPLFSRNQFNTDLQAAILRRDQLDVNIINTEQSIDVNIRTGVLRLVNEMSNIQLSEVSEQTAKESLDLTMTSYTNGAVNIVQLIDAQNNYINAQLAKANAIYNFLLNALQLERSLGYFFFLNSQAENEAFKAEFFQYLNRDATQLREPNRP
ncbi:TolC family protein [Marinicella meishanensis]|uniref:TolC family protein n=1 Tax=Marinicella meishanensis TaxID=2873263 RepID=UPI001CBBF7E3|nr:TolC family protein [Marinicella sp. NBU2979]